MDQKKLWIGVTIAAVLALAGREFLRTRAPAPRAAAPVAAVAIPAELVTLEAEMKAGPRLAGLTAQQRLAVLRVMADKPCDCGCPHGSSGRCLIEDPDCPRAPVILTQAIDKAREGATYEEILAAVKKSGPEKRLSVQQTQPMRMEAPAWSPVRGPAHAKVTIVEFSDFQCPFCERAQADLETLRKKYGKDLRLVFRHLPLPSHLNAMNAAEAAMAAGAQGKFWEMHDQLFAHRDQLDRVGVHQLAKGLGLDLKKFEADMEQHRHRDVIGKDAKAGAATTAGGTPILFINGRIVIGAQPIENLAGLIEEELPKAEALIAGGISLDKLYETIIAKLPPLPGG